MRLENQPHRLPLLKVAALGEFFALRVNPKIVFRGEHEAIVVGLPALRGPRLTLVLVDLHENHEGRRGVDKSSFAV